MTDFNDRSIGNKETDFNDKPIENTDQDLYGMAPFAERLAKGILNIKNPVGTTIALSGEWGSGKSSTINLVKSYLSNQTGNDTQNEKNDSPVMISEFKCWWFRGEEALAIAFLKELIVFLGYDDDEIREKLKKIAVQVLPIIGVAVSSVLSLSTSGVLPASFFQRISQSIKKYFSKKKEALEKKKETLEELFKELNEKLSAENRRFLIIIDDMDRLAPDEMLAMFRLVKTIGRLPNVLYLLAFDRKVAEKVVSDKFPAEGAQYLEKIIQVNFNLPTPSKDQLIKATQKNIKEICGLPHQDDLGYYEAVVSQIISIYITTPRHVVRLQNAIRLTWPMIANEINIADFIALEIIRLYEPKLFIAIKENAYSLTNQNLNNRLQIINLIVNEIPQNIQENVRNTIIIIFQFLEDINAYDKSITERRICIDYILKSYLKFQPETNIFTKDNIQNFLKGIDNPEFIKAEFKRAVINDKQQGTHQITDYFHALMVYGSNKSKEDIKGLIKVLLELYEIFGENICSKNIYSQMGGDLFSFYIRSIKNLTLNQFTQEERKNLLLDNFISTESLGWYVSLIDYLYNQFLINTRKILNKNGLERFDPLREYNVTEEIHKTIASKEFQRIIALSSSIESFIREDSISVFIRRAFEKINEAKNQGTLLNQYNLLNILLFWRNFKGGDHEVKNWTDSFLNDSQKLLTLAKAMQSYYLDTDQEIKSRVASKTQQNLVVTSKFYNALKKLLDNYSLNNIQLNDEERDLIISILESKNSASS